MRLHGGGFTVQPRRGGPPCQIPRRCRLALAVAWASMVPLLLLLLVGILEGDGRKAANQFYNHVAEHDHQIMENISRSVVLSK
ncbi:hypothetical protein E2562_010560 [Oryza meyeriana var. granulata]|uniref:Uncharacterized protein n=1 Tax=Oryza meyeriana var. granulata TaxID=110450 RepID=A0A6G1BUJ2_9ORYZ|nr:hypothetical protein E2562_010560 [Oryza meyeriana var. granulata]